MSNRCRRTPLPPSWRPDADGLLFAAERGLNVLAEFPAFRRHYFRTGIRMACWDAAWRCWCWSAAEATAGNARAA